MGSFKSLTAFLLGVLSGSWAFQCPDAGQYPHEVYCNIYHSCTGVGMKGKEFECQHGRLFNTITQSCDKPDSVDCQDRSIRSPDTPVAFQCPTEEGTFAHETYCYKYYVCIEFHHNLLECILDKLFDDLKKTCEDPEIVDCGDRLPRPTTPQGTSSTTATPTTTMTTEPPTTTMTTEPPTTTVTTESPTTTMTTESPTTTMTTESPTTEAPTTEPPTTTGTGNFECTEDDGFFPDPENCEWFYECIDCQEFHFQCPNGTWWHQDILSCDHPGDYCTPNADFRTGQQQMKKGGHHPLVFFQIAIKSRAPVHHESVFRRVFKNGVGSLNEFPKNEAAQMRQQEFHEFKQLLENQETQNEAQELKQKSSQQGKQVVDGHKSTLTQQRKIHASQKGGQERKQPSNQEPPKRSMHIRNRGITGFDGWNPILSRKVHIVQ